MREGPLIVKFVALRSMFYKCQILCSRSSRASSSPEPVNLRTSKEIGGLPEIYHQQRTLIGLLFPSLTLIPFRSDCEISCNAELMDTLRGWLAEGSWMKRNGGRRGRQSDERIRNRSRVLFIAGSPPRDINYSVLFFTAA